MTTSADKVRRSDSVRREGGDMLILAGCLVFSLLFSLLFGAVAHRMDV